MTRDNRHRLIKEIEKQRGTRLIAAIWGDRPNHNTIIASDSHVVFFDLLQAIGQVPKIDLLLYTTGGQTLAAWGLANLLREYCQEIGVLIPHRAFSAGTLLTLAANEIVMSRLGQLSPIDPSITSPLGPQIQVPGQPGQFQIMPISVEDAVGYIDLARAAGDLKEEASMRSVFERLSSQVHPLALGAVYRSREQIQTLADRLLAFHMVGEDGRETRERIVLRLTRELGSHDYTISRTEAKNVLSLNVVDSPIESLMLELFGEYSELLHLRVPYNPEGFLGTQNQATGDFDRAIIETTDVSMVFRTTKTVQRVQVQQPGVPVPVTAHQQMVSFEGWTVDNAV